MKYQGIQKISTYKILRLLICMLFHNYTITTSSYEMIRQ